MNKCKHENFSIEQINDNSIYFLCSKNGCDFYGELQISLIPKSKIIWEKPNYTIRCPKCGCEEGLKNKKN